MCVIVCLLTNQKKFFGKQTKTVSIKSSQRIFLGKKALSSQKNALVKSKYAPQFSPGEKKNERLLTGRIGRER